MGIYGTKTKWQRALRPVVNVCVARRIHPDVFIYAAILLCGAAGLCFLSAGHNRLWLWLVPPCLLLRLVLNLLDGQVARAMGLASAWGEVKNEFADRLADLLIFTGLAFGGYVHPGLAALTLGLILITSYLGILAKALGGPRVYTGIFAKGDRMISLAAFTLYPAYTGNLGSYNLYLVLASVAAGITIVQRLRVIHAITQSPL
jgi:CDP-diacylglycerol--glycerol-3-phosphate 3-phosphatidyltransferase